MDQTKQNCTVQYIQGSCRNALSHSHGHFDTVQWAYPKKRPLSLVRLLSADDEARGGQLGTTHRGMGTTSTGIYKYSTVKYSTMSSLVERAQPCHRVDGGFAKRYCSLRSRS
jgi:hypothetical protein